MSQTKSSVQSRNHHAPRDKRAILRCDGDLAQGFRVNLEISDRVLGVISEAVGELPASLELLTMLQQWRQVYRMSLQQAQAPRISLESVTVETGSLSQLENCRDLSRQLQTCFQQWLSHPGFQKIEQRLRESLHLDDAIEILLRTPDFNLYQLPWHSWDFIQRYPQAELVLSMPSERLEVAAVSHPKVRILAILGDRTGIDTNTDRLILEKMPNAEVMFLVEPSRQFLYRYLWEQSWDILFFAGHSYSSGQQGILNINVDEALSLEDLKYGLKKAIARGLKLAIFNSCDGLGLAHELEQLHIPQFIVMREPVPDRVAQEFLKRFLQSFSSGESLPTSVRHAREWLHSLEGEFPCASWLPILFHNPAMASLNWQTITQITPTSPPQPAQLIPARSKKRQLLLAIAATVLANVGVLGARSLGWLEPLELWAYDQTVKLAFQFQTTRPAATETQKVRVIGITRKDTQRYGQGMREQNVISDVALAALIRKINQYQPKVIGLDIARDTPQPDMQGYQELLTALQKSPKMVVACQVGEDDLVGQQAIPSIAAPKLNPAKPIGYADSLLPDRDNVVRRYALQMPLREESTCRSEQSFAWQVVRQANPNLALKSQVVANFGGYQGNPEEFGDDQLLINYHASIRNITPYSLQDILYLNNEEELRQLFQSSIVLIGYTLENKEDYHLTPIGSRPGVMMHTYAIRQLFGQTPAIWTLPEWSEILWILVGGSMGGVLVGLVRSRKKQIFLILGTTFLLSACVYFLYLQNLWIPIIPVIVAFMMAISLGWMGEKHLRR
jgi:CHASE2 domain-containing sensor protein